MRLVLTIYTDESLTDVKRVVEADRLKIPYRVTTYVGQLLEGADIDNVDQMVGVVCSSLDKVDKIIKATFGISDTELDCVDAMELGTVAFEIYKWGKEKIESLKSNNSKNAVATA